MDYLTEKFEALDESYSKGNFTNRWVTEREINELKKEIEKKKTKIKNAKEMRENWISEMKKGVSKKEIAEALGKEEGKKEKVEE